MSKPVEKLEANVITDPIKSVSAVPLPSGVSRPWHRPHGIALLAGMIVIVGLGVLNLRVTYLDYHSNSTTRGEDQMGFPLPFDRYIFSCFPYHEFHPLSLLVDLIVLVCVSGIVVFATDRGLRYLRPPIQVQPPPVGRPWYRLSLVAWLAGLALTGWMIYANCTTWEFAPGNGTTVQGRNERRYGMPVWHTSEVTEYSWLPEVLNTPQRSGFPPEVVISRHANVAGWAADLAYWLALLAVIVVPVEWWMRQVSALVRDFRMSRSSRAAVSDVSRDGEPADPAWDEAKNR